MISGKKSPVLIITMGPHEPGAMESSMQPDETADMPDYEAEEPESSGAFEEDTTDDDSEYAEAEAAEPACLETIKGMLVDAGVEEEKAATLAHDIYKAVTEELAKSDG